MRRMSWAVCIGAVAASQAWGVTGSSLTLRSSGNAVGSAWNLSENGYVGTYINVAAPGNVTIDLQASGTNGAHMSVVVGDIQQGVNLTAGSTTYQSVFNLQPGTYFVRAQLDNAYTPGRTALIQNLDVSGASVSNVGSSSNALAAANTYIEHYRQGDAAVQLYGVAPGTDVQVRLKNHAFNFGTAISGTSNSSGLIDDVNPSPTSDAYKYQQFVLDHFNAITPENAGKWSSNEPFRDFNNLGYLDTMLDFAEAHGLRTRMHNLIWGSQQPGWVNTLLSQAVTSTSARDDLRNEISERIDYYVGDGNESTFFGEMARRYYELDVFNESWHTGENAAGSNNYWDIYGASGVANIYEEVAAAVAAAGADVKLFVNEYNILQNGPDNYGNWYRRHIEQIQNADGDPSDGPVGGVGMQYYVLNGHSAGNMQRVLQNLSVLGLPLALTEFGVQSSVTNPTTAAGMLEDSLRMMFGNPDATSFMMWGFWANAVWSGAPNGVLVDANWNLTEAGVRYEALMDAWRTDLDLTVAADGTIDFTGFFGDYEILINGVAYDLALVKGETGYQLIVALLAGDANKDGVVDAKDYLAVEQHYGATGIDDGTLFGDANFDGRVDGNDLLAVTRNFGATAPGAATPEPGTAALLLVVLGWCKRRPGVA